MQRTINTLLITFSTLFLITGYLSTSSTIASMAPHSHYPDLYSAAHDVTINQQSMTIKDTAIYKEAWLSINGADWQSTTLQGIPYADSEDWLATTATATLPSSILNQGEHYIITYSCTYNNGWDCHGGKWQLRVINNTVAEQEENCTDGVQNQDETGIDCGGSCEPCPSSFIETIYAINAGGDEYAASDGNTYEPDSHYAGGTPLDRGDIPVANTEDDYLYSTERYGDFTYSLPVAPGTYEVTLKFMEGYLSTTGGRVFDVRAEGTTIINDLDIYEQAGRDAAHDRTFTIQVNDEELDLDFVPGVQNPQVGAILVKGEQSAPPPLGTCDDGKQNQDETGIDCGGSCEPCQPFPVTAESSLLAGVPLIHDQTFLIPEDAVNGDTVGQLNLMWVGSGQEVSFSMISNPGNHFSINDQGVISIAQAGLEADATPALSPVVRATETSTGKTSDATVTVLLSRAEDTYHIDPSTSTSGTGTRSDPYQSWDDVTFQPGKTYLQRRGTTAKDTFIVKTDGLPEKHTVLGAYGAGTRPEIDCSSRPDSNAILLLQGSTADGWDDDNAVEYIDIYSYEIHGCKGIRSAPATKHIIIRDVELYDCSDNGAIYLYHDKTHPNPDKLDILIEDAVVHDNPDPHGIKFQAGGGTIRNTVVYNNGGHGISFAQESGFNTAEYIIAYDNGQGGVELGGPGSVMRHGLFYNNYFGLVTNDDATGVNISGVVSYGNAYGVSIGQYLHGAFDVIVEDTEAYRNTYHGIAIVGEASDVTIRNNLIHDNDEKGIKVGSTLSVMEEPSRRVVIYNNTITNNPVAIGLDWVDDAEIYDNTLQGNDQNIVEGKATNINAHDNTLS
ncbi:right-handed parallel beta-helix repeat-containing protein [Candidatus Woesearchaeota archaeon]|nr:right-handed parallel beta-helix repeat-containing protein [Candidatus Woesearchaeota archaeon]